MNAQIAAQARSDRYAMLAETARFTASDIAISPASRNAWLKRAAKLERTSKRYARKAR